MNKPILNPDYPYQVTVSGFEFNSIPAVLITSDSYQVLLDLLNPEQRETLRQLANTNKYVGFSVRVNNAVVA